MKSQTLVIDLVRNWLPSSHTPQWEKHEMDGFDIILVLTDPEYPGMEKIQGKVIWEKIDSQEDRSNADRDQLIHVVVRKFAKATGTKFIGAKHVDKMTYLDFKGESIQNAVGFDWVDVELEKEINV